MFKKINLFLLIMLFTSVLLTATIELNNQTNINYETQSNRTLNVQIELGNIEINQIEKNNQSFIAISADNSHFLNNITGTV